MSTTRMVLSVSLAAASPFLAAASDGQQVIVIEDSLFRGMVANGTITRDPDTGYFVTDTEILNSDVTLSNYLEGLRDEAGTMMQIREETIQEMQLSTQEGIPEK